MAACGVQVVERNNDRWRLEVAAAAVAQTAHEIVPHFRQINAQQGQIVLPNVPQQLVNLLRSKHTIVGLTAVDRRAPRIGEIAHQFCIFLLGKPLQHRPHPTELRCQISLFMLVDIPVNRPLMLVGVCEVVVTLMLPQLLADLLLAIRGEVKTRQRVGKFIDFAVGQIFENPQQITARLGQQIGLIGRERGMEQVALVGDAVIHEQLVKRDILHHTGNVGIATVGEIVAGLPLILRPDTGAAALRMEIGDRKRSRAVECIDGVFGQINGVHRVSGVPVIDQFIEPQLLEKRSVERETPR